MAATAPSCIFTGEDFFLLLIGKKVCRVIRRQYTNNKTDLITEMRL